MVALAVFVAILSGVAVYQEVRIRRCEQLNEQVKGLAFDIVSLAYAISGLRRDQVNPQPKDADTEETA